MSLKSGKMLHGLITAQEKWPRWQTGRQNFTSGLDCKQILKYLSLEYTIYRGLIEVQNKAIESTKDYLKAGW